MTETTTGQTVARGGDVDAPGVQFDAWGRQFIDYDGENSLTAALEGEYHEGDGLFISDVDGDRVWVPHAVLVRMLPALTTYAEHKTFIAPPRRTRLKLAEPAPIQSAESGGLT